TPKEPRLAAHRGAERVRLLAVAPGEGDALTVSVRDRQERSPRSQGTAQAGVHRYGNGKVFRFATLDYKPDVEPVAVSVTGAGDAWKVVAVPEYRLSVRMGVFQGGCDRPGPPAPHGVDTGSTVCVISELINGEGEVVGGEVTGGDLRSVVRVRRPDQPSSPVTELTANQLPGDRARFGLLRSNLSKGDYELQPVVTLSLSSGDAVHLRGRPMLLEVSSMEIRPQPDSFHFKALHPGQSASHQLVLTGSFPPVSGRLEWRDRGDLPGCISAELSGVAEGKSQSIVVDQAYNLSLRVAPYCGPQSFRRPFDTVLRLVFEPRDGRRELPAVELPVRFGVNYEFRAPRELVARVKAGEVVDLPLEVTGNFEGDAALRAVVAGPEDPGVAWTKDPEDLSLGFAGPERGELLRGEEDAPTLVQDFKAGAGEPLRLRVVSDRCCAGGAFGTRVGLAPATRQAIPEGAPPLEPTFVPVRIQVEPAGLWACYGPRILWAAAVLLLLLLLLYLLNMFRNSSFLRAEALASKLKPLVWTAFGDAVERKGSQQEVLHLVRKALPFRARVVKWLQANPLRFGLPGGAYRETVELFLQPSRDVAKSQIVLRVERDLQGRMARQPETYGGRLFATALGGVTFLAVPDGGGRLGRLSQQDTFAPEDGKPRAVKLSKARLLKSLESWESYEENTAAGWQVG
ncbi:MAG TPA: hypothetical protein VLE27_04470, partial [Thermoanaerobaculia bacterium]|nr:hypothetical protein [Thermoanaerobaculia bacterium]